MEEKKFSIPESQANLILKYLSARPYAEVAQLVHFLLSLKEVGKLCECDCPPEE